MNTAVILSNLQDPDAKREDMALGDLLKKHFEIKVLDFFDDEVFSRECFFLIRNVWGRSGGTERIQTIYQDFDMRGIKYSVPFTGKGDQRGKLYLVDLYNSGRQVVPTFDDRREALRLKSSEYLLKPIHGGSGKGIISISKEDLSHDFDKQKYVIQPKLQFESELSFFFVDNNFQYAPKTKASRWDLELYTPAPGELSLANEFVSWNHLVGIQRIDFLKDKNGRLFLLEIEDWCPYLSLLDVQNFPNESFIGAFTRSINSLQESIDESVRS